MDPHVLAQLEALTGSFRTRARQSAHHWKQVPLLRALQAGHRPALAQQSLSCLATGVEVISDRSSMSSAPGLAVRYADAALVTQDLWADGTSYSEADVVEVARALGVLEYRLSLFDGSQLAERLARTVSSCLEECMCGGEEVGYIDHYQLGLVADWRGRDDALGAVSETMVRLAQDWSSDFRDLLTTSVELTDVANHPDLVATWFANWLN